MVATHMAKMIFAGQHGCTAPVVTVVTPISCAVHSHESVKPLARAAPCFPMAVLLVGGISLVGAI